MHDISELPQVWYWIIHFESSKLAVEQYTSGSSSLKSFWNVKYQTQLIMKVISETSKTFTIAYLPIIYLSASLRTYIYDVSFISWRQNNLSWLFVTSERQWEHQSFIQAASQTNWKQEGCGHTSHIPPFTFPRSTRRIGSPSPSRCSSIRTIFGLMWSSLTKRSSGRTKPEIYTCEGMFDSLV